VFKWLTSFVTGSLPGRTQTVVLDGVTSSPVKLYVGFRKIQYRPGPLLFWLSSNWFKFNADQFIWHGTRQQLHAETHSAIYSDVSLAPVSRVRDLIGVLFDHELTVTAHINHVVSGSFYQLRQLRSVRRCLLGPIRCPAGSCDGVHLKSARLL